MLDGFRLRAEEGMSLNAFTAMAFDQGIPGSSTFGPLTGVPIGVKDIIDVAGLPTTGGFKERRDQRAPQDAACSKALRDAGALIVGKLNTSELSTFPNGENGSFGTAVNPWGADRIPGGSSSGSAVAVSTGMVAAALGADTGGSVRVPAACCGVVWMKPTYGWISNDGMLPLAWTLDHVGVLARDVADCAHVLDAMGGWSSATSVRLGMAEGVQKLRVGVPSNWIKMYADPDVREQWSGVANRLTDTGAELVDIGLPDPDASSAVSRLIIHTEEAAWWERHPEYHQVARTTIRMRKQIGRYVAGPDYVTALQLRELMRNDVQSIFARGIHAIATPTLAMCVPRLTDCRSDDPVGLEGMRRLVLFTSLFSLCGLPAVSVPSGLDAAGIPMGVQFVAPSFQEGTALRVAAAFESTERWEHPSLHGAATPSVAEHEVNGLTDAQN
ncbi:MAG TPA: amidase [Acidimicrobiales bacterium]|jgi:aspartyl-tRNA(Asn)/glutamyl-tRNA(Gln) amidotransferase subunit A|nr:amidase [Acidimicrobiales bacterium]